MSASLVVSDAGPLLYLILIDCVEVPPCLFDRVLIPFAVRDELIHPGAPRKVKEWIARSPAWLEIAAVADPQQVRALHIGEAEALQLALERKVAAIPMDDLDGRAAAKRLGVLPVFTVAILERAAEMGLIDLHAAVANCTAQSKFGQAVKGSFHNSRPLAARRMPSRPAQSRTHPRTALRGRFQPETGSDVFGPP